MRASLALILMVMGLPAAADPVTGFWLTQNEKAIIEISPCDGGVCGRMAWMVNPLNEAGEPKLDVNNTDQALKIRAICGLAMVGGMAKIKDGVWKNGWIYNPRDGETYSAEVSSQSDTELRVRGYLGVPLLGRSQIWTRVADARGGC